MDKQGSNLCFKRDESREDADRKSSGGGANKTKHEDSPEAHLLLLRLPLIGSVWRPFVPTLGAVVPSAHLVPVARGNRLPQSNNTVSANGSPRTMILPLLVRLGEKHLDSPRSPPSECERLRSLSPIGVRRGD